MASFETPPPSAPDPVPAPSADALRLPLVAIGLLVIGSGGPWVTFAGESQGGLDKDGVITLALALIAAITLIVAHLRGRAPLRFVVLACGALALVIAIIDILDVTGTELGAGLKASVGWGLWLTLVGSLVLCAAGVQQLRRR